MLSPRFLFDTPFNSCKVNSKNKASLPVEDFTIENIIEVRKFLDLGMTNHANQKLDSAFYFYNRSKILSKLVNDSQMIVYNLVQMTVIQ